MKSNDIPYMRLTQNSNAFGDLHECESVNVFAARAGAPGKTAESGMGD